MEKYLILVPIFCMNIVEAYYKSMFGDKRHWASIVFVFILSVLFAAALPTCEWWQGVAAFIAIRIWFDYLYNAFSGLRWSYVGTTAKTDLMIRWLEQKFGAILIAYLLLIGRLIIFVASIMVI